jgi:pimeloyl-ACP methyl ester carboxylesterase
MTKKALDLLLLALLLVACTSSPEFGPETTQTFIDEEAIIQEITFKSKDFRIVGDLRLPAGKGPYPAIIMIHGDGPASRDGAVSFAPTIRRFLRNGYAVLSWDKPGSGDSTGELDREYTISQRAAILADGLEALTQHPAIDSDLIGLWGLSQAGWVMPSALELTDDVDFMIVVSGGAEDGIEQMAYQIGQRILDNGGTPEQAALYEQLHPQFAKATTYDEYRQAMERLLEITDLSRLTGISFAMTAEEAWQPWPRDIDAFFDPMSIIEHTTMPMLVFFGERDKLIDPVQGARAYEAALQRANNQDYQIVTIPHAGHGFFSMPEYLETMEAWLQHLEQ